MLNAMKPQTMSRPVLVQKSGNDFLPLFSKKDVPRDKFLHLRKELIELGCDQNEAMRIARTLSMQLLKMKSEEDYLEYIRKDTYASCKTLIGEKYPDEPVQDPGSPDYYHVSLFSSIYHFEVNFFKSRNIKDGIADIGCGD